MSHMSKIGEIKVRNIEALKSACGKMGLEFREGQKTARYHGSESRCSHAIRVPGCSNEIGVVEGQKGEFHFECDFWNEGRKLAEKCGKDLGLLSQQYNMEVARATLRMKGMNQPVESQVEGGIRRFKINVEA